MARGRPSLDFDTAEVEKLGLASEPVADTPAPERQYGLDLMASRGPLNWEPFAAPALDCVNSEGKPVHLEDYRGKNVLLVFYLPEGCVHCVKQLVAMRDDSPLETYAPSDPNASDRFMRYECAGTPTGVKPTGSTSLRCPDGSVPRVRLELAAALAAGDAHARRVCASRRALAAFFDSEARSAHAAGLDACSVSRTR